MKLTGILPLLLFAPPGGQRRLISLPYTDSAGILADSEEIQRRLLETCASLLAISLERIHYIDVASKSTVQIESERLRNSLLSAISHDLRTPLTALVGLAETLTMTPPARQGDLATSIRDSALRMNAMVINLLDMARLEAGAVRAGGTGRELQHRRDES